ncbi:hypothetical protein [Agrobacterium genomosp. 13]|uniref:Uncharacterized protein n=1 Tax=Agrobacterium genomosp. 13 str. CFBP 6927 TaxID=1183428 RepID=A0ABM9VNZ7_9HYPH|nr:hypothetical protein [Agrobacterium genomosp. 13]CUX66589.1 conserved hypothetical protein [Agrobacterium genomosp. 13 str. CFBP 6927]
MISTHAVILHRDSELDAPVTLQYVEETLRSSQRRFEGRTALCPQIDLGAYQWASVIDWIDVEFVLGRRSQHWKLNDRIARLTGRKEFPEALEIGPGGTASRYRLRVQEPDFSVLRRVLADIEGEYGFASPAVIIGIEVSIDAYPYNPGEEARALLHGVLVRHFYPTTRWLTAAMKWPRAMPGIVNKSGDYIVARNQQDPFRDIQDRMTPISDRPAPYASTYYLGAKNDSHAMWRIQNKTVDKQNKATGTRQELTEEEKRIRIEVTLGPDGCKEAGLADFDGLAEFSFTGLQKSFFQFRLPTFATYPHGSLKVSSRPVAAVRERVEEIRKQRFLNAGVLGLEIREDARGDHLKLKKSYFLSWHKARGSKMPKRSRVGAGPYGTHINYQEMARVIERALAGLQRKVRREMKG